MLITGFFYTEDLVLKLLQTGIIIVKQNYSDTLFIGV